MTTYISETIFLFRWKFRIIFIKWDIFLILALLLCTILCKPHKLENEIFWSRFTSLKLVNEPYDKNRLTYFLRKPDFSIIKKPSLAPIPYIFIKKVMRYSFLVLFLLSNIKYACLMTLILIIIFYNHRKFR